MRIGLEMCGGKPEGEGGARMKPQFLAVVWALLEKMKFKEPIYKRKRMFLGGRVKWGQCCGEVKLAKN